MCRDTLDTDGPCFEQEVASPDKLNQGSDESTLNIPAEATMEYFAGIDVSLEFSRICIVDGRDKIIWESTASDPDELVD